MNKHTEIRRYSRSEKHATKAATTARAKKRPLSVKRSHQPGAGRGGWSHTLTTRNDTADDGTSGTEMSTGDTPGRMQLKSIVKSIGASGSTSALVDEPTPMLRCAVTAVPLRVGAQIVLPSASGRANTTGRSKRW